MKHHQANSCGTGCWESGRSSPATSSLTAAISSLAPDHVRSTSSTGQHEAIIDDATWDTTQRIFEQTGERASPTTPTDLLLGKLFDDAGHPMLASTAHKGARHNRYYVSAPALKARRKQAGSLHRIAVRALDDAVLCAAQPLLASDWARALTLEARTLEAIQRIEIGARQLTLVLKQDSLDELALATLPTTHQVERSDGVVRLRCPIALARPRNAMTLIRPNGASAPRIDAALVRAVTLSRTWVDKLEAGQLRSIRDLAKSEQVCILHTAKLLPLAYLAPDLVEMILDGRQPARLTLTALIAERLPESWAAQRDRFAALA